MCAARGDRADQVVPYLQAEIDRQDEQFDDTVRYVRNARRFHEGAGVAVRQQADDPVDRIARVDLVGSRIIGVG